MFVELAHYLSELVMWLIKNELAHLIMGALGLSGGAWLFLVKFGLTKLWKRIEPEIESAAHLEDQKQKDEKLNDQYQKDIKEGADEKKLIKDESSILNSGKH